MHENAIEKILQGAHPEVKTSDAKVAPGGFLDLMERCWVEKAAVRPDIDALAQLLAKIQAGNNKKANQQAQNEGDISMTTPLLY